MIHIATVHWKDASWIDIQITYLKRNISEPFRVYAWLNEIPENHQDKFYYVCRERVKLHAIKLNILADLIYFDSNRDDDLIIFLDGDAFPVGDVIKFGRDKLKQYPLVAIQRLENNGDLQPHPCFCMTTVGFWKKIKGDWKKGYSWLNLQDVPVTDVGGNLLGQLIKDKIQWYPMMRSNTFNLHPLWYGIYEGLVYHHGAAFRNPISRIDLQNALIEAKGIWRLPAFVITSLSRIGNKNPDNKWQRLLQLITIYSLGYFKIKDNKKQSVEVFQELLNNHEFHLRFNSPAKV